MEGLAQKRKRAQKIYSALIKEYPDAHCTLDYRNPYELLVATILAAQCTDERVNIVTPALFERYPDAAALARAEPGELEEMIRSTGFFRNKAKSLLQMATAVIDKHGGEIPSTMADLTALAGVGRKTANVVLGNCFGAPALIVDTHFKRLSTRLGFTREKNPAKIEDDLAKIIPEKKQTMWSHLMVFHGRNTCTARKPKCPECPIRNLCPYPEKTKPDALFAGS